MQQINVELPVASGKAEQKMFLMSFPLQHHRLQSWRLPKWVCSWEAAQLSKGRSCFFSSLTRFPPPVGAAVWRPAVTLALPLWEPDGSACLRQQRSHWTAQCLQLCSSCGRSCCRDQCLSKVVGDTDTWTRVGVIKVLQGTFVHVGGLKAGPCGPIKQIGYRSWPGLFCVRMIIKYVSTSNWSL